MNQVKTQREIEEDAAVDYERTYQESQDRMRDSSPKVNSSGGEFRLEEVNKEINPNTE